MPLRLALSAPRRPPGSAYKSATGALNPRPCVRARVRVRVRVRVRLRLCDTRTRQCASLRMRGFIGDAETMRAEIGQLY